MECKKCLEIHKRDSNQKIQCPFCNEIIGCFWHNRGVSFKHLQTHKQKEVNNLNPNPTKGEEQR